MNGYELTHKMRKARRKHHLNATDQALFYELIAICNEEGWPKVFQCSNAELCTAIRITENTLVKSRSHLIDAGLITFKSGKSKRAFSTYSLTTSNFEVDTEVNPAVKDEVNPAVKTADYYKGKPKPKPKKESKEKKANRFSPPSKSQVYDYMIEKNVSEKVAQLESEKFTDFYNSKNWYVGKNKMTNWKSSVSGWINRMENFNNGSSKKSKEPTINRQTAETIQQNSMDWVIPD